jgi:PadR family transcriptional regulator
VIPFIEHRSQISRKSDEAVRPHLSAPIFFRGRQTDRPRGARYDDRPLGATPLRARHPLDGDSDLYYFVWEMANATNVGQFEQLILIAILALGDDAYGVTIHAKAKELAEPKDVSLGAVYVTLDRLEDKGLLSSRLSDPTPERGGRAKRCYRLEALGERALRNAAITARRMWETSVDAWGGDWEKRWRKQGRKEPA